MSLTVWLYNRLSVQMWQRFVCLFFFFLMWCCFVLSFNQAANYLSFQIYFDDMDIFKNYCVIYERHRTVPQIRVVPMDTPQDQYVVQVRLRTSIWARLPAAVRKLSPRPSPNRRLDARACYCQLPPIRSLPAQIEQAALFSVSRFQTADAKVLFDVTCDSMTFPL